MGRHWADPVSSYGKTGQNLSMSDPMSWHQHYKLINQVKLFLAAEILGKIASRTKLINLQHHLPVPLTLLQCCSSLPTQVDAGPFLLMEPEGSSPMSPKHPAQNTDLCLGLFPHQGNSLLPPYKIKNRRDSTFVEWGEACFSFKQWEEEAFWTLWAAGLCDSVLRQQRDKLASVWTTAAHFSSEVQVQLCKCQIPQITKRRGPL